ncbi:NADPH-dependent oxidoreductase [Pasteurellaceae bacterium LIM206]|nr:NADPH-dependent oxidoreductase [Pasteurellaceae bacterium LIM206]
MNPILELQQNHCSIRHFKPTSLTVAEVNTLLNAARSGSTSSYMQSYSIISITDPVLKAAMAEVGEQPYIERNGHLFLFVADLARNAEIARQQGIVPIYQGSMDRLLAGVYDATIAAQNLVLAAESLGLGAIYLGSILNDSQQIIDLLGLPALTFPVFAVAVGYPAQSPRLKPRLPNQIIHMYNRYVPISEQTEVLTEYDQQLDDYYRTRGNNARTETFSGMAGRYTQTQQAKRMELVQVLRKQGFLTELEGN